LSNYYPVTIESQGFTYGSLEAAFQAAKCIRESDREKFEHYTAAEAKKAGRRVDCRSNWESNKKEVMLDLLRIKFGRCPELGDKLLATGNAELIEGNTWHDQYWGSCTCPKCRENEGENHLGKLLMLVRAELLEQMKVISALLPNGNAILARVSKDPASPGICLYLLNADGTEQLVGSAIHKELEPGESGLVVQAHGTEKDGVLNA